MLGTNSCASGGHNPSCPSLSVPLPCISKLHAGSIDYTGLVLHARSAEEYTPRPEPRLSHLWSSCFRGSSNEPKLISQHSTSISNSRKERSFCIAVLLGRAADALGTQQPDSLLQAWLAVDQAATYALIAAERCATDGKAFQLQLQTNPVGCETATPVGQNPSLRPLSLPQRLLLADLGEPHGFLLIQSCKLEVGPSSDGSPCAPRPAVLIRPAARPPSLSSPLAAPPPTPPATSPMEPADTRRTLRKPDSSTQRQDIPATGMSSSTNALTSAYTGVGPFVAEPASCLTGASSSAALQEAPAAVPLSLAAPAEPSSQLHGWGPRAVWVTALEYGPQLVTVLRYPGNVLYQNSNSRDYWGDLSALPLAGPRLLALLLGAERTPGGPQHDAAATSLIEEQLAGLVTRLVGGEVVSTLVHLPPSMAGAVAHSTSPWAPPHTPHMLPSAHKPGAAPSTATDTTAVKPRDGDSVAVPAIDGSLEPQRTLAAAASASISPAVAAAAAGRGGSGPVCDPVDRQLLAALMCDEPSVRGGVSNQHSSIPTEMAELCQQKPNNVPLSRDLLSMPLRTLKYSAVLNNGSGGRLEGWGSADAVTTGGSKYGVGAGAGLGVSRLMGVGATIDELASVNMSNEAGVEREQAALIPDTSLGIIVGGAEGDEDSMEAAADVTFACLAQPSERQSSVHCDRIVGSSRTSAAAAAAVSARNGIPTFGTVSCLLPYFSLPVEPAPAIPSSPPPASTADVSGPLPHSGMAGLQSSSMPPPQPRRKRFTTSALPQTLQRLMDAAAAAASNHKRRQPLRRLVSDLSAASAPNPSLLKLTAGLQTVQTLPPRRRAALADAVARPSSQPVLPPPLPPPPARMAATLASSDTLARATIGAADEYRKRAPVSVVFEEAFPVVEPAAPAAEPQLDCAILSLDKTPLPPPSSIIDTTACGERTAFLDSIQSAELPPCLANPHGGNQPCLADDPDVSSLCGASPPPCPPFAPRRSFDMSCLYEADGNTKWYGNGGGGYGMAGRPGTATGRLPMRFSRYSCSGNTMPVVGAAGVSEQHGTGAGHAAHPRIRNRVQTSVSGRSRRPLLHTDTQGRVQMLLSNFTQRLEQQQQQRQQQQQQQYELQRQRLQQQQLQQQQFRPSSYRGPVSCDGGTMMRLTRPSDAGGLTETATIQSPHRRQRAATVTSIECESPSHASKGKQRLLEGVAWRLDEDGKMVAEPTALEERRGEGEYAEGSGNGSGCGGGSSSSSGLGLGNAVGDTSSASQQLPELVPQTLSSPARGSLGSGTPETPSLWHQVHIRVQPETSVHVSEARAPEDSGIVISSGGGGGVGGVTLDPAPGAPPPLLLVVTQVDVTPLVEAQLRTANLLQQEHRVLESIFPRHCIEYLTLRGHMTAGTSSGAAGEATAATAAATSGQRNPDGSAQDASSGTSIPAKLASLATWHPGVTILFCDIVGFTTACHSASAFAVMGFLNELYSRFDALVDIYKVYKVETIGDCYMVAGGLVAYDEDGYKSVISGGEDPLHAVRVMEFSKAMLRTASGVRMPHTGKPVQLRVGLHSGPVTSGVVGDRMPRFCLFGDTVNTASRMESTCRPGAIHVSAATQALLPRESWVDLGCSEVKGKGQMRTFEWAGQADEPFESGQMQRVLGLYL